MLKLCADQMAPNRSNAIDGLGRDHGNKCKAECMKSEPLHADGTIVHQSYSISSYRWTECSNTVQKRPVSPVRRMPPRPHSSGNTLVCISDKFIGAMDRVSLSFRI